MFSLALDGIELHLHFRQKCQKLHACIWTMTGDYATLFRQAQRLSTRNSITIAVLLLISNSQEIYRCHLAAATGHFTRVSKLTLETTHARLPLQLRICASPVPLSPPGPTPIWRRIPSRPHRRASFQPGCILSIHQPASAETRPYERPLPRAETCACTATPLYEG